MKRAIVTASLGLLASLTPSALATSSYAHERVTTAGAACVAISGTATYSVTGQVTNESTTTSLRVDCPLGFTAEPGAYVMVNARVRNNGSVINCTFYMENASTGGWFSASDATTTVVSSQTLEGALGTYDLTSIAALHAYCTLPPKNGPSSINTAAIRGFVTGPL